MAGRSEETHMTKRFCISVEYRYRRKPIPKSRLWHMTCYKGVALRANQLPGALEVSEAGADQVSIFIAVPCNEQYQVDSDTQTEYEDFADQKFKEIRPHAELA
jgi:hypothetical protein